MSLHNIMSTTSPTPDYAGQWVLTAFGNPSVLRWKTFVPRTPLDNQVLIRVLVTGISGVDNMMRTGEFPHPLTMKPGFVPGQECVGRIEAIGPDVSGLRVGEPVVSFCFLGAYATHVLVSADDVIVMSATGITSERLRSTSRSTRRLTRAAHHLTDPRVDSLIHTSLIRTSSHKIRAPSH